MFVPVKKEMLDALFADLRWAFDRLRELQEQGLIELELADEERLKRFEAKDKP